VKHTFKFSVQVHFHRPVIRLRNGPVVEAEARLEQLEPATIMAALNSPHNAKVDKYGLAYDAGGHMFCTFIASTRGPIHPEAQRLLYIIPRATTRQHMHSR